MAFKSTVDFTKLKSVLSVLNLKSPFTYQNLQITDVLLDADSKNLFFTTDASALTVTISESLAQALDKAVTETISISEAAALAVSIPTSDSTTISESYSDVVSFVRAFSDAYSLDDTTSASDDLKTDSSLVKNNVVNISESLFFGNLVNLTESPSISEASALASGKNIGNPTYRNTVFVYYVTVASGVNSYGGGNKYYFNGGVSPEIDLELGVIYRFDQSDSSNAGHPLRFSTTANGTHGGGTAYTTNVTVSGTPGQAGAYVEIDFDTFANSLHYYCAVHSGMGNKIITRPEQIVTISESFANAFALATIANSVSVSESINVQLISGANSVFNASPLNTYTINS